MCNHLYNYSCINNHPRLKKLSQGIHGHGQHPMAAGAWFEPSLVMATLLEGISDARHTLNSTG